MSIFAVVWKYTDNTELINASRQDHRDYIKNLAGQGVLKEGGAWTDGSGGLLVFDVSDSSTLRDILDGDPYTTGLVITSESVHEWAPGLGLVTS
jgi:uncharacterized protein YciI